MNKGVWMAVVLLISTIFIYMTRIGIADPKEQGRFLYLQSEPSWSIVVDTETGVEYFTNRYIFTPLVDESGNPLIWEGEIE